MFTLVQFKKQMKGACSTLSFFLFQENICKKAWNSKCILLSEVGIGDKQGVITEKPAWLGDTN